MGSAPTDPFEGLDAERASDGPVALSPEYLMAVERLEREAANRAGTDKSWVLEAMRTTRLRYATAERIA